jgi:iron complex outermembrane receptor protein
MTKSAYQAAPQRPTSTNNRRQPRALHVACLLIMSTASSALVAQQPATDTPAIEEIRVISSMRRPEELSRVNASVSILGDEELRLVSHTHIQESANRLPGVNLSRNNGQESLTAIRSPVLSGGGACGAFLLAEQGIPLRAAGFCNVNELFDAHSENAERIEVIRGPSSAFYGSNAVHGMINVVLPAPSTEREVSVEAGPRGSYRVNARAGFEANGLTHSLLFNGASEEGYRSNSGYDQQKLSWLYQYTTDAGVELDGGFTFTNLNQDTAGFVEGPRAYKDSELRRSNPNPEAYRNNQSVRAWTRISYALDSGWEVVLTPYLRHADLDFIQHFLPGTPVEENRHSSAGLQFATYRDLSEDTTLSVGMDIEFTEGSLLQAQEGTTVGSPMLVETIPPGRHYDYDVDAIQAAPFAQIQHYWDNGLDVTFGVRYERMNYDYRNNMVDGRVREDGTECGFGGCRYNRPSDRADTFGNWAPKLGLRYQMNENHNAQLRLTRGYRAPQATELYRLQNQQNVADLDAVEIDSVELGFEGFGEGWNYEVVAFWMDKDNEIITDSDRINLNGMHTRHRGVEFSGALDLSEQWQLSGAYSYARHTYENDQISQGVNINGLDVESAPRHFGSVQMSWRPLETLRTELQWVTTSKYYTSPANLSQYDGHSVLNLRTRWQATEDLTLALNVLNLTNRKYAERAGWTPFGGDRYFPGEPLRAFVSASWRFN